MNMLVRRVSLMLCLLLTFSFVNVYAEADYLVEGYPDIKLKDYSDTTIKVYVEMVSDFDPNSEYAKRIEEICGMKIEWITPPRESYKESLTLLLSSGDYPDLICGLTEDQFKQGAEAGVWTNLDSYIDLMPDLVSATYSDAMERCKYDGSLYGIPRCASVYSVTYMLRKDWADKLNLKIPETLEEYKDFMIAIANGDPDGNGRDDTYALSPSKGFKFALGEQTSLLLNAFGCGYGFQDDGNGNLIDTNYVPEVKNFFNYVRELMEAGAIDPAWITNTTYAEQFYNGQAAMVRSWQGSWAVADAKCKEVDPNASVVYIDPPIDVNGELHGKANPPAPQCWNVIPASSKNVEAVCQFLNCCFQQPYKDLVSYGVEGVHSRNENGKITFMDEYEKFKSVRTWLQVVRDANYPPYFLASSLSEDEFNYEYSWYTEKMVPRAKYDMSMKMSTPTWDELKADGWESKIEEVAMKIIYGELEVEAWDDICNQYYEAGFDKVIEEINEWYHNR